MTLHFLTPKAEENIGWWSNLKKKKSLALDVLMLSKLFFLPRHFGIKLLIGWTLEEKAKVFYNILLNHSVFLSIFSSAHRILPHLFIYVGTERFKSFFVKGKKALFKDFLAYVFYGILKRIAISCWRQIN